MADQRVLALERFRRGSNALLERPKEEGQRQARSDDADGQQRTHDQGDEHQGAHACGQREHPADRTDQVADLLALIEEGLLDVTDIVTRLHRPVALEERAHDGRPHPAKDAARES